MLHDEIWNLVPTFRNVNSAKNDRLPVLEDSFAGFCNQQFDSFIAARSTGHHGRILEQYLCIDEEVFNYEDSPHCRELFSSSLRRAIFPLHQIAMNQGFGVWTGQPN